MERSKALDGLFLVSAAISLALPNLVYSGVFFFQTLHIMKWTVALVPVATMAILTGIVVAWRGSERTGFKVDLFGWIWFALLVYVTVQPIWAPIKSVPTFYREWFFFASLWGFYVLCLNLFRENWLRPILWLASLNGAINVFFAEFQVANNVNIFAPLKLILPTPGNYIGNTGQQNMLGLWLAITSLGSIFLYLCHGVRNTRGSGRFFAVTNLMLLPVLLWGLWNSTSRSAILSLLVGLAVLALMIAIGRDRARLRRLGFSVVLIAVVLGASILLNQGRSGSLISKGLDLVKNADTLGGRDGIWKTSWAMAMGEPIKGMGLGQYKWNYLDAQKKAFSLYPDMKWQYTNWAHNEYLQWYCESGLLGFIVLIGLAVWWLFSFFVYLKRHKGAAFPNAVLWSAAFLFLIWFDALWTRPFHRIENSLWMPLAFALANREIFVEMGLYRARFLGNSRGYRVVGIIMASVSLWGLVYLGQGLAGDVTIRRAVYSRTAPVQRGLMEKAHGALMVRDIAERQLAYHYIAYGEAAKDPEALAKGLNMLLTAFRQQPTAEDLRRLLDWSGKLKKQELLKYLVTYLKPGTYRIEQRK
ncbi:O-antigen ligase family protein [Dethiosulfovibrio sp. F2B]|uniref:O-antigen ligase family protein n=1 Tax=Dethiosulfovibrio faecalis TaxID=2720018 RepID=UPI001F1EB9FC|nr:O-antigen ligase family protein [Dethiosulfovibrio faecalis]MCF4150747.1 O-antigen ligase family protein [Dethiosulfovibrio faecalis]